MAFLTDSDYDDAIRSEVLAIVQATSQTRQSAELKAQAIMEGYLSTRYDVKTIFSATGADRNPIIIFYLVDITLYNLHKRITTRVMPQDRKDSRDNAIEWLKMVAGGELNPDLPLLNNDTPDYYLTVGCNEKYSQGY